MHAKIAGLSPLNLFAPAHVSTFKVNDKEVYMSVVELHVYNICVFSGNVVTDYVRVDQVENCDV